MRLALLELRSRRLLDHETMRATFPAGGLLVPHWTAFAALADAECCIETVHPWRAAVYEANLRVKSPVRADEYRLDWKIRVDASGAEYPFVVPQVTVLSPVKPWLPHVNGAGAVCLGNLWSPTRLVAHLVVDLLRMLNFDEKLDRLLAASSHFNLDSITWWARVHGARPINAITYPVVQVPEPPSVADHFGEIRRPGQPPPLPAGALDRGGRRG